MPVCLKNMYGRVQLRQPILLFIDHSGTALGLTYSPCCVLKRSFTPPRGKVLNHKFHNPITEVCCTSPGPHCGPEGRRKEEERKGKGRGSMDQEKRHFHHEREGEKRGESPIHPEGNSSGSGVLTAIVFGEETISPWFLAKKSGAKTICHRTGRVL